MSAAPLSRRVLAECLGTMALLCAVIGSGIMAERLSGGNVGVALLANTAATVGALYVLIELFGPISGAHFNPAVSAVMAWRRGLPWRALAPYVVAQLAGAVLGAWLAHAMCDLPLFQTSTTVRSGPGLWLAEGVATAGLVLTVLRAPAAKASSLVAAYIGAAYWFTASTSFANPAVALARAFTGTFAGIRLGDVPGFVLAEIAGGLMAALLVPWLAERSRR